MPHLPIETAAEEPGADSASQQAAAVASPSFFGSHGKSEDSIPAERPRKARDWDAAARMWPRWRR